MDISWKRIRDLLTKTILSTYLEKATKLDEADPLAHCRSWFHYPAKSGEACIYLCGNSLGLQPKETSAWLSKELSNWQEKGVAGHFSGDKPWVSYHQHAKPTLAALLGAKEHEVIAMNNLTTNLHLALTSFYRPEGKRNKILIEKGAFPSDFYAVHSHIVNAGLNPDECLIELAPTGDRTCFTTEEIVQQIETLGAELALVLFPGVQYYTGQFFDIQAITKAAHRAGAKAGYDLAHAIGNVPLSLHESRADFAVWCSYKYLNSGPGGVGGLFIHESLAADASIPRLSGWWGHDAAARFQMENQINPIPNVDGWQLSNINILSHAAHLASLAVFDKVGIENLRAKSTRLTGLLEEALLSSETLRMHTKIITPAHPAERGCQLSLYLPHHGKEVFDALVAAGIVLDWREPNVMRVAPVPLYNTYTEVVTFVQILEKVLNG